MKPALALSTWLLVLTSSLLQGGCAIESYSLRSDLRPTAPLTSEVAARFAFEHLDEVQMERLEADEGAARVYSATMTVRVLGDPEPVLVQFEFWQAREAGPRAPAIVITPILGGGRSLAVSHCRAFTEAGMHAVLVDRGTKVLRSGWTVTDVERHLRRAVVARRAVVDWLETRRDVDPDKLGAFGISMGGILTSILLAVEPRLSSGVVALAGADVPGIIGRSVEGRLVKWRAARAADLGVGEGAVEALLRAALVSDPGHVAPFVDPRRVLLVSTRWDDVVPTEHQELLWERLGRPLRYDLPAGHYTGIIFLPWIMDQAVDWFGQRFQRPAASEP